MGRPRPIIGSHGRPSMRKARRMVVDQIGATAIETAMARRNQGLRGMRHRTKTTLGGRRHPGEGARTVRPFDSGPCSRGPGQVRAWFDPTCRRIPNGPPRDVLGFPVERNKASAHSGSEVTQHPQPGARRRDRRHQPIRGRTAKGLPLTLISSLNRTCLHKCRRRRVGGCGAQRRSALCGRTSCRAPCKRGGSR